ncbi:MAG: hypothetical protein IJ391_03385 [Clostridia bacterium]|nr:hypothetical protein [Clostridia bacterium]
MSYTPNLNLLLTPEDDTTTTFKDWRVGINGEEGNSNMAKIDEAYGALNDQTQKIQSKVDVVSDKVFGDAPKTWGDVQTIVRNGAAAQYFDIGDQFIVEKLSAVTASKGTSTGITAVTVNANSFVEGCGEVHAGEYVFTFDGKSWRNEAGKAVKIENYGISVTGTAKAGDHVIITETSTQLAFDVIGIDHDTPADGTLKHSMTLQMHDLWPTAIAFDATEATWYIDEATYPQGLVAGTYHFTLPAGYDNAYGGGSTLNFTLTKDVPVGGQIRFAWSYNVQANTCKISTYESIGATAVIETVSVADGEAGTAMPTLHATAVSDNANCVHRFRYGSNNWAESGLRQWLNTDAEANTWWEPKTVFDRPIAIAATTAGFLKGIDPAFLDVVGEVVKTTQESISDEYGHNTSTERFFLLSRPEVYAGTERSADGADGKVYEYYGAGYSDLASPGTGADSNRIKYRNGSATYWWLRTPYSTSGHDVRLVYPTGTLNNVSANSSLGVAPACVIV